MKGTLAYFVFILFIALGCKKKDDDNNNNNNTPPVNGVENLHLAATMTADARAKILEIAPVVNGNPKLALIQTLDWLLLQDEVASAFHQDSTYLYISMSSGIQTMVWINEIDAEGYSKYRGSGSGQLNSLLVTGECNHEIENKNVLIYAPGEDEFGYDFKSNVQELLENSNAVQQVTYLKNAEANIEAINTFSNYGLVLIETHGSAISFMTGNGFSFGQENLPTDLNQFQSQVSNQIGNTNLGYLLNGKMVIAGEVKFDPLDNNWWANGQTDFLNGKFTLWATAKYLESMPSLSNTVVFGNFCYSGWTTIVEGYPKPIGKAFLDLNPITYYAYQRPNGYSQVVDNDHSMVLEENTVSGLLDDNDNTGTAHQDENGNQFQTTWPDLFLVHLAQTDWCYQNCDTDELTDSRDGNVYRTVTIGSQTWMAENLRYLPFVHTNAEFATAADNASPAYGVYGYNGTDVQEATAISGYQLYGVLYNWYALQENICPAGWHIPTDSEWSQLAGYTGLISEAGKKLKSQSYWDTPSFSTDEFCFSAVPGGARDEVIGAFHEQGLVGFYWTNTEVSNGIAKKAGFMANAHSFQMGNWAMGSGVQCRCVQN